MLTQPLKWHGGKRYLAKEIIALMPPRIKNPNAPASDDPGWVHYVEPYAGGLAVLLAQNPECISEVVGDINLELTDFWRCLQDENEFSEFVRIVQAIPFSEYEWKASVGNGEFTRGKVARAVSFFVRCRQSLAGRMDSFAGVTRTRARKGMNEQASAWLNAVDGLPEVHQRIRRVLILDRPALEVIKSQDGPRTLFYLDPPYLHSTRSTTGEYEHEMSEADHQQLLYMLAKIEGRFLLSGYRSEMYDSSAEENGWRRVEFDLPNNAAGGKEKQRKIETVWMNY